MYTVNLLLIKGAVVTRPGLDLPVALTPAPGELRVAGVRVRRRGEVEERLAVGGVGRVAGRHLAPGTDTASGIQL